MGDREINGCGFLHHDEDGRIDDFDDFMVTVCPPSAAQALQEAMAAQLDRIAKEAAGAAGS